MTRSAPPSTWSKDEQNASSSVRLRIQVLALGSLSQSEAASHHPNPRLGPQTSCCPASVDRLVMLGWAATSPSSCRTSPRGSVGATAACTRLCEQ
jgi:hypothetical protein